MKKTSLFIALLLMVLSVSASLSITPSGSPGSVPPARTPESVQNWITKGTCRGDELACHIICPNCGNEIYIAPPVDDDTFEMLNGRFRDYIVECNRCKSVLTDITE